MRSNRIPEDAVPNKMLRVVKEKTDCLRRVRWASAKLYWLTIPQAAGVAPDASSLSLAQEREFRL